MESVQQNPCVNLEKSFLDVLKKYKIKLSEPVDNKTTLPTVSTI